MDIQNEAAAPTTCAPHWWLTYVPPIALLLFGCIAVALYVLFMAPLLYPYPGDASSYIEAARSLLAGKPLLTSVPFGNDNETQVFRLWPPGLPLLMAAVASFGIEAAEAGLWLSRLSVALLPLAVYWAVCPAVGRPLAIVAALLAGSAFGLLRDAHLLSSDAPFALAVALALGFLLRGLSEDKNGRASWFLVIAGLVSALAITIRNSGISLALAEGATLAALWIAREASFTTTLRRAISLALGGAVCGLPLLAWNLRMFGELMPYGLPPSTVGVAQNIADLMNAITRDLLLTPLLSGPPAVVVCLLLMISAAMVAARAMVLLAKARREATDQFNATRRRTAFLIFAVNYSLISAIMLIATRSRYEWGEFISERHVAQFDWLLAIVVVAALAWRFPSRRVLDPALIAALVGVLALRGWNVIDVHRRIAEARDTGRPIMTAVVAQIFIKSATAADLIRRIPAHCDIISNAAIMLISSYQRHAWMVWDPTFTMEEFAQLRKPSVLIFIPRAGMDITKLEAPSGADYRTIRDPAFVAFVDPACGMPAAEPRPM